MLSIMRRIMSGEVTPVMIAALTVGLRVKKETIGEIASAAQVMREFATKRPGAYTAFASSSRAFALYQQAQCDYVRVMQPDANAPPTGTPSAADIARLACRVDLARERIETLK
jgi:aminoglycoside phosphotransferase